MNFFQTLLKQRKVCYLIKSKRTRSPKAKKVYSVSEFAHPECGSVSSACEESESRQPSIYSSQQGVISDSPITPFERVFLYFK